MNPIKDAATLYSHLEKDWRSFHETFSKMGVTLRDMGEEGEGVMVMAKSLVSNGILDEVIGAMTNEKLASLADSVASTMESGGRDKNYVFGMVNLRGSLDLYLFRPVTGETISVTAGLPDCGDEIAGQLYLTVWISKNIERYAAQNDAIVFSELTDFLCGI